MTSPFQNEYGYSVKKWLLLSQYLAWSRKKQTDVITKTFKHRLVLPSGCKVCSTPILTFELSFIGFLVLQTCLEAEVNNMRLTLLQGIHWEHKAFAWGTMNGFGGVKDNLFSCLSAGTKLLLGLSKAWCIPGKKPGGFIY